MGQHKNVYNVYKRSADSGEGRYIFNTRSGFVIDTSSKLLQQQRVNLKLKVS